MRFLLTFLLFVATSSTAFSAALNEKTVLTCTDLAGDAAYKFNYGTGQVIVTQISSQAKTHLNFGPIVTGIEAPVINWVAVVTIRSKELLRIHSDANGTRAKRVFEDQLFPLSMTGTNSKFIVDLEKYTIPCQMVEVEQAPVLRPVKY